MQIRWTYLLELKSYQKELKFVENVFNCFSCVKVIDAESNYQKALLFQKNPSSTHITSYKQSKQKLQKTASFTESIFQKAQTP